jgi:ketosteroid isomerase-like protein
MYDIDQIEVSWHKATSTKNLNLMMSLWADNATFTIGGQTYSGKDQIRNFFATKAAPFQPGNTWVSDTPAYKIQVTVNGDKGTLYFECHYLEAATKKAVNVVAANQDVQRINGKWLITTSTNATAALGA